MILDLRDSSVVYSDNQIPLAPLCVNPGEEWCLVGASGSGKTTTFQAIAGLQAVRGQAQVFGVRLEGATAQTRQTLQKKIGVLHQDFYLLDGYSALENVVAALGLQGAGLGGAYHQAKGLLERVGLGNRSHATPAQLSTGERQRVALARALASRPQLLLADEPTAHLDEARGQEAMALLRQLRAELGAALVVATHDPSVMGLFANRLEVKR